MMDLFGVLFWYFGFSAIFSVFYFTFFKKWLDKKEKEIEVSKIVSTVQNDQFLIIRFDEENNISISNNAKLIKDDLIRIIQEVSKLKTID